MTERKCINYFQYFSGTDPSAMRQQKNATTNQIRSPILNNRPIIRFSKGVDPANKMIDRRQRWNRIPLLPLEPSPIAFQALVSFVLCCWPFFWLAAIVQTWIRVAWDKSY